jgi:hypothetical protein
MHTSSSSLSLLEAETLAKLIADNLLAGGSTIRKDGLRAEEVDVVVGAGHA